LGPDGDVVLRLRLAWLTSYGKADDRLRRMHVLDHLLDLMKAARAASTLEELQKLRTEVDTSCARPSRRSRRTTSTSPP